MRRPAPARGRWAARTVRIVEAENRRLREHVGRPEAARMRRVALDLGGPSLVAFDEEPRGDPAERHGRRVEEGIAGDEVFGLTDVRDNFFRGLPGARADA